MKNDFKPTQSPTKHEQLCGRAGTLQHAEEMLAMLKILTAELRRFNSNNLYVTSAVNDAANLINKIEG